MRRSYDHRSVSVRRALNVSTVLRFLKICKSADYYKVEEAMMIVEHRRVILRTPDENAKIGIVRSSHYNRRPNVTYALVIVVIDVRIS